MIPFPVARFPVRTRELLWLILAAAAVRPAGAQAPAPGTAGSIHLDHVPVAVRDLPEATARYRALGFTPEAGRPHDNGIATAVIRFPNGTVLELITVDEPRDSLARWYADFLDGREGGAFVALRSADLASVIERLGSRNVPYDDSGPASRGFRTVAPSLEEPVRRVFFIEYLADPGRPAAPPHANTVTGLRAVWLAMEGIAAGTAALVDLGLPPDGIVPLQPLSGLGRAFPLASGELVLVAPTQVGGRTAGHLEAWGPGILGATLEVANLDLAVEVIHQRAGRRYRPVSVPGRGRAILIPPGVAHGMWLELLEPAREP